MRLFTACTALLIATSLVAACGPKKRAERQVDPAVAAANKARNDAIMRTATEVVLQGRRYKVGHSPDRKFALVKPLSSPKANGFVLELAAREATGCDVVFEGGVLKFVPGITNMTPFQVKNADNGVSVLTYCEGDTRKRATGLADGRPGSDAQAASYANYPQVGRTYLSFNKQHGFQVSYYQDGGRSWLWYPGNQRALPEDWQIQGDQICFRHPENSYNPATRQRGGKLECAPADLLRRTVVADLPGDAFGLAKGTVPYARPKCQAPDAFEFDRAQYKC